MILERTARKSVRKLTITNLFLSRSSKTVLRKKKEENGNRHEKKIKKKEPIVVKRIIVVMKRNQRASMTNTGAGKVTEAHKPRLWW